MSNPRLQLAPRARTKNIVISGTNYWNPGDDFVRDGVVEVLRRLFGAESLNLLFYNFNPDLQPPGKLAGASNLLCPGDLERCGDLTDAVVVAGLSAGDEIKELYRWVIANRLTDRVFLVGAGYENGYAGQHASEEPEATIFRQARLVLGRTRKAPASFEQWGVPYQHLNCPAILSVPEVRAIEPGRGIGRIGFSIQLPDGVGLINQTCAGPCYELALRTLQKLSKEFDVEVIAHHKTEYFHFLNLLRGLDIPVHFSSFYQDLFTVYRRYDLVVTTRLHASLFANGHGIPGIILNDTDRHTHALEGFPHSVWVNSPEGFEREFARVQRADLAMVAREAQGFKAQLMARYLGALAPAFGVDLVRPAAESVSEPGESGELAAVATAAGVPTSSSCWFDSEFKEQASVRALVKPAMTVFDVGANVGKYTKLFSSLVGPEGKVFAFEPDPDSAERVRQLIAREKMDNVMVVQAAVCERAGEVTLQRFPEEYSSWNSLGHPKMEDPRNPAQLVPITSSIKVAAVTLDEFCRTHSIERIDYLKLDVEGAELRALEGASGLLSRGAIRQLQFEVSRKMLEGLATEAKPVFDHLNAHGYTCRCITADGTIGALAEDSNAFYENYLAQAPVESPVSAEQVLPVHFFTIVLNGMPFLTHHIEQFRQLPFPWHWHIVEGVAALNHDTAWSKETGGGITPELHRNGLSHDGTREYLDELARRFPENVSIYRKLDGAFWDGKLEMVNAPLARIQTDCLLWQVDADELWTATQIIRARALFLARPDRTAAFYYCHYFVGDKLIITSRETYGNHSDYEWLRTWRYSPGCKWTSHEPPRLCTGMADGTSVDLGTLRPLRHAETEAMGLVFQHFAYTTEAQLRFKEVYYGYADATQQWDRLQQHGRFPVNLRDFWHWVTDQATVDTAASQGVIPLAWRTPSGQWTGHEDIDMPRETEQTAEVKRVLFVRTDAIGDAVLASSMLPWLQRKYPNAELAVLCQEHVAELYLHAPGVSAVVCFDRKKIDDPAYWRELVRELNGIGAQVVINFTYSRDVLSDRLTLAVSGAKHVAIRSDLNNISEADRSLAERQYEQLIPTSDAMQPELARHRECLAGLGLEVPPLQPRIWAAPQDEQLADAFFGQHGLDPARTMALFPGAQHDCRVYGGYAEALRDLKDYRFLILGGAEFNELAGQLATRLPGQALNLCGRTSIGEMAALVRRCRLYVGSESAGAHIACAVGVPNVVLLGGGHFGRFMPYSPLTSAVSLPLDCFGCNWRCPHACAHCVKDVPPAVLGEAVRQTLETRSSRPRLFVPGANGCATGQARFQPPAALAQQFGLELIEITLGSLELPRAALELVDTAQRAIGQGNSTEAILALERAVKLAPRHPELLTALGNLYCQCDRLTDAQRMLATAEEAKPQDTLLPVLLAHVCLRLQDAAGFEAALGRALKLDPGNLPALRLIADARLQAGQFAEAARVYRTLIERGHADTDVALGLGRCFVELGNLEGARLCYEGVLQKEPANQIAGDNLEQIKRRGQSAELKPSPTAPRLEAVSCPVCASHDGRVVRRRADIVECGCCHTVYLRTRLTKEAMRELYQSYAEAGSHMTLPATVADAERSGLARDYFLKEILQFTEPKGTLLDVGCGWGGFLLNARKHGFEPKGIEITRKCVRYANDTLGMAVVDTPLERLELAPESLRVVTMNHVLEHLPEPRAALARILASLAPGGMYCGIVPNFASACSTVQGDDWYWLDPQYHYTHFTPATLRDLLESAGFVVERLYTATGDYGAENVRKACLRQDPKLAESDYFAVELKRYETDGRGEEIRFFARKPAQAPRNGHSATASREPLVSVVVSAFNSEKFMAACLENLARQTIFDQIEVIVVDSGSEQNERALVEEFQRQHSNVRYLRTARESLYGAWNRSLAVARGRYWVNANTDDALREDALELFVKALDAHPDAQLGYADCVWTSQPNDRFPSAHVLKEVCYPEYEPIYTLFYCLTGCAQFWRTESLRQLGGFDATLRFAGDYQMTLRLAQAGGNAVHIPDFLSLFYQNRQGLTQQGSAADQEHHQVMETYRATLPIERVFACRPDNPLDRARAWTALGLYANDVRVPWERQRFKHEAYAFECFRKAFEAEPECLEASLNYIVSLTQTGRGHLIRPLEASDLFTVQEALTRAARGETYQRPHVRPAVLGPAYDAAQGAAQVLALEPAAIQPWTSRRAGRFTHLSRKLILRPRHTSYSSNELEKLGKELFQILAAFPPFYAHFGGAGDALLLLSSFYDQRPGSIIVSYPNSIPAARAFFEAFPQLGQVYFLPLSEDPRVHVILRWIMRSLPNCLGAGATPKEGYDEWKAGLDIEKAYHINRTPRWAAALRHNDGSRRVGLAPKGSLNGMVGSKRNVIDPPLWPEIIGHLLEHGFEPVVLGTPEEEQDYPVLAGCLNARSNSFGHQMEEIGRCAALIGADSWAKTFSALAGIPTIVFEPLKGPDWQGKKDPSDFVFLERWPAIRVVENFAQCQDAFRQVCGSKRVIGQAPKVKARGSAAPLQLAWEGSFLDCGSLSHVNRELTRQIALAPGIQLTRVSAEPVQPAPAPRRKELSIHAHAPEAPQVTVRHAWPPNWTRPRQGALVVIQPWEYGMLPEEWVRRAADVDQFWVPSAYVRQCYINSGVEAAKVHVVPNGVDELCFHPTAPPCSLKTRKRFKFLFVGGTIQRKGPDLLLRAYLENFTAADDVCLVIKDFGAKSVYAGQTLAKQITAAQQLPNAPEILYLQDELSPDQVPGLYTACDCLVHPYRGEGFGLPILEAMACALPVIVTGGGAADDFATDDVAFRVPATRKPIGREVSGIRLAGEGWVLEPDLSALAAQMKWVVSNREAARAKGSAASAVARTAWTWKNAAIQAAARLHALGTGSKRPVAEPVAAPVARPLPTVALIGDLARARVLLREKQYQAAWQAARETVALRPYHPEAFLLLAEIAQRAGDLNAARQSAARARALAPDWKLVRKFLKQLPGGAGTRAPWAELPCNEGKPRLSVCLIVKNEEKFLDPCLKSVRALATQIVVVDTGSTDRTVEIARQAGAEVHSFAWCEDFSAARNAALERATGDWVLMLDADEELAVEGQRQLAEHLGNAKVMGWRLPITDVGREEEGCSYVPRLFRNAPGVHYIGRVHEQVFASVEALCRAWGLENRLGQARLLHHGYTAELTRDRAKVDRNLRLLERALGEQPQDAQIRMNLGLELARSGREAEALGRYREAFEMLSGVAATDVSPELRETLLSQYCTRLVTGKQFDQVCAVLTSPLARSGTGLTSSLHFALGLASLELGKFSIAAEHMQLCLTKRNQRSLCPINKDILTAAPRHCLALCLAQLGKPAAAEKAFQEGLTEAGNVERLRLDYGRFLFEQNRPLDALQLLQPAVAHNSQNSAFWRLGGQIALSQPRFLDFACDWTAEAVRYLPEDAALIAQRAEALLLTEQTAPAGALWQNLCRRERSPQAGAAVILCTLHTATAVPASPAPFETQAVSRAFIDWYRKCVDAGAERVIRQINHRLPQLRSLLPEAAKLIEAVVAEAARDATSTAEQKAAVRAV